MFSGFGGSILNIKLKPNLLNSSWVICKISFIHLCKLGFLLCQVIILSGKHHVSLSVTIPVQAT